MDSSWSIKSPRFQLIMLGLIGSLLLAIWGYLVFLLWLEALFIIRWLSRRASVRSLMLAGVVINLIVTVISAFGLGPVTSHASFWDELERGVGEQLVLGAIVGVILYVVFGLMHGRIDNTTD